MITKESFYEELKEMIEDEGISVQELEEKGVLFKDTFKNFRLYCPSLKNAISIANYCKLSLDFLFLGSKNREFTKYSTAQTNFYENLCKVLKENKLTKYRLGKELGISDSSFSRWRAGTVPKFLTVLEIAKFIGCSIDELLDHE